MRPYCMMFIMTYCGCSNAQLTDSARSIAASNAKIDVSTDSKVGTINKDNVTIAPKTTGANAYHIATEHALKIGIIDNNANYEFTVLYDQKDGVWTVFYRRLPYRLGAFFSIIVNGNDGRIIDVQRGE